MNECDVLLILVMIVQLVFGIWVGAVWWPWSRRWWARRDERRISKNRRRLHRRNER